MRGRLAIIRWVRIAVVVFLVAAVFAMLDTTVSAHHRQEAPAPICEFIEGDDLDDMRLERINPMPTSSVQHLVPAPMGTLVVLRLSPIIFQPPEAV